MARQLLIMEAPRRSLSQACRREQIREHSARHMSPCNLLHNTETSMDLCTAHISQEAFTDQATGGAAGPQVAETRGVLLTPGGFY